MNETIVRVDGTTPGGTRVRVTWPEGQPYGAEVWIDGESVELDHSRGGHAVSLYRDGGSINVRTVRGSVFFPKRLRNPDRTPRFNGEPIT